MTGKPLGSKIRGGKKSRFLESDPTVDLMGKRLLAPIKPGVVADQRNLLVGGVRPDPEHHRRILVNMSVLQNPDLAPDEETRRQAEGIIGLSQSIQTVGQLSPIDVYLEGAASGSLMASADTGQCVWRDTKRSTRLYETANPKTSTLFGSRITSSGSRMSSANCWGC